MDKRSIAAAAAIAGMIVGVAGASALHRAPTTSTMIACAPNDAAAEAKADAIVKQLHSHDHEQYVPQPVTPIGDLPKPAKTN